MSVVTMHRCGICGGGNNRCRACAWRASARDTSVPKLEPAKCKGPRERGVLLCVRVDCEPCAECPRRRA